MRFPSLAAHLSFLATCAARVENGSVHHEVVSMWKRHVIILGCKSPPRMPVGESSLDLDPLRLTTLHNDPAGMGSILVVF